MIDDRQTFIDALTGIKAERAITERFRDFCQLTYCVYAKRMDDGRQAESLNSQYAEIVRHYDKSGLLIFSQLTDICAKAIRQGGVDFLGDVGGQLKALDKSLEQIFTPWPIAKFMASSTLWAIPQHLGYLTPADAIAERGFIHVIEPAVGAGVMLLALADALEKQGFDPGIHMLVNAVDLSQQCYHMTFIQLTWRGIPALVEHGDTLLMSTDGLYESAYTPPMERFYEHHHCFFDRESPPGQHEIVMPEKYIIATEQLPLFNEVRP